MLKFVGGLNAAFSIPVCSHWNNGLDLRLIVKERQVMAILVPRSVGYEWPSFLRLNDAKLCCPL